MVKKTKHIPKPSALPDWTFLSNHGHVLLCLALDDEVRLRDIALLVGITERAVNRIISELEEAGYITRIRVGRRNRYIIESHKRLRHPLESHKSVEILLGIVQPSAKKR